jgi:tol-pal system protein YbgF
MAITVNGKQQLLAGVAVAVGLVAATTTSDAAWWNLGKKAGNDTVEVAQSAESDRINRIEAEMRTLTGQIEELTFQLQELQDQLKRIQEDADFRFRSLEGDAAPPPAPRQVGQTAPVTAPAPADAIGAMASTAPSETEMAPTAGPGAPPRPLGTLIIGGEAPTGEQPLDLSALARGGSAADSGAPPPLPVETTPAAAAAEPVVATAPTGDATTDFNRAYNLIISGNYDLAEASFKQFLTAYPSSEFAPDAQYWLGESFFARARYRDAADAFRAGYKAYPDSSRAPATLLRLGQALAGLAERDAACQIYAQVLKQYPDMSNALHQRVVTEQASANC